MIKLDYFDEKEFQAVGCSSSDCSPASLRRLDEARRIACVPFVLTSAFRSVAHERAHGRDGSSSHTKGLAFDVAVLSSSHRFHVVRGAILAGFTRIGIASNFVHMDDDKDKPACIWLY